MSDKFARFVAGLAVLAVAVIAGIVSYSHIDALALAHGYSPDTARLLPLSVDGLIVASSLVLVTEARALRPAPLLARAGLWIAITATLSANVLHGVAYGPVGALTNAWPGVAFILASEILLGQMRRARTTQPVPEIPVAVADSVPGTVTVPAPQMAAEAVSVSTPASVPETVLDTVLAGAHVTVPEIEPESVPAGPVPTDVPATVRTVARRAPGRASGSASRHRASTPESVFSDEISRGELPSLRAVKNRMSCGTDRAREILGQLQDAVAGQEGVTADA
jgi:hypothetical protein